jgi:hypothetical protein
MKTMHHYGSFIGLLVLNILGYGIAGVAGILLWQEAISMEWCLGIGCLIAGTYLLMQKDSKSKSNEMKMD